MQQSLLPRQRHLFEELSKDAVTIPETTHEQIVQLLASLLLEVATDHAGQAKGTEAGDE
jgi:hypothetical protein